MDTFTHLVAIPVRAANRAAALASLDIALRAVQPAGSPGAVVLGALATDAPVPGPLGEPQQRDALAAALGQFSLQALAVTLLSAGAEPTRPVPVVVTYLDCGVIVRTCANVPTRVIYLDSDTEGADMEGVCDIGGTVYCVTNTIADTAHDPDRSLEEPGTAVVARVESELAELAALPGPFLGGSWTTVASKERKRRELRLVFASNQRRLIALQVRGSEGYEAATADDWRAVEDSLKQSQPLALTFPEAYSLQVVTELPDWAATFEAGRHHDH